MSWFGEVMSAAGEGSATVGEGAAAAGEGAATVGEGAAATGEAASAASETGAAASEAGGSAASSGAGGGYGAGASAGQSSGLMNSAQSGANGTNTIHGSGQASKLTTPTVNDIKEQTNPADHLSKKATEIASMQMTKGGNEAAALNEQTNALNAVNDAAQADKPPSWGEIAQKAISRESVGSDIMNKVGITEPEKVSTWGDMAKKYGNNLGAKSIDRGLQDAEQNSRTRQQQLTQSQYGSNGNASRVLERFARRRRY